MLCENCKKNNATTYFKRNINGNIQEVYLCSECAAKMDMGGMSSSLFDFLVPQLRIKSERDTKVCSCGTTFYGITKSGKVGCPDCYETFKNELFATLRKIHGNKQHTGRRPVRFAESEVRKEKEQAAKVETADRETVLRQKLENAIKAENFEEAAKLRDEIRELKEGRKNEQQ